MKRLFNCLEQTLRNRHSREISLKKLTLASGLFDDPDFASFVDQCICYAVGSDVKELKLDFMFNNYSFHSIWFLSTWFYLPQTVLCTQSIQVLELSGCKLELPRTGIQLSSLRELCLSRVSIDDHLLDNLVYSCPSIEVLSLCWCYGLQSLNLSSLSRLKRIVVLGNRGLQRLNIEALNIHLLCIGWSRELSDVNVAYCYKIKDLSLSKLFIRDEWLCKLISGLPLLNSLRISNCYELKSVKISSPCLKVLCVDGCLKLVDLKIDTPNLQQIQFFEFLAKLHRFSQQLILYSSTAEGKIVSKELREILSSPLSSVKHLYMTVRGTSNTAKIVDELLWISPHTKTITVQHANTKNIAYFEFSISYKKQLVYEGNFVSCCKSYPLSCWQHCIAEVKLTITDQNHQNEESIKSYILKGADILERIDALCKVLDM